jgi:hypothetical protein
MWINTLPNPCPVNKYWALNFSKSIVYEECLRTGMDDYITEHSVDDLAETATAQCFGWPIVYSENIIIEDQRFRVPTRTGWTVPLGFNIFIGIILTLFLVLLLKWIVVGLYFICTFGSRPQSAPSQGESTPPPRPDPGEQDGHGQ